MMKLLLGLIAAIGAQACMRERTLQAHTHHNYVKRQESNATFPPVLDANEQILLDSFDNTSISTWSYYYSTLTFESTSNEG
jgi:N-acetylated-alpha-linked acidic dipeptidase